ncbi:MAG TPA: saccharopine dehydrogenase C-terminal domain-containing protein [Acidimicrobiales bacterium]|nr:saccharopine dehydrogenase C-terminal domain-containing protein [Acidimicrobiales bacterium]
MPSPTYGRLPGVVLIGLGSIGRGTLPLILRHFDVDPATVVVVGPESANDALFADAGIVRHHATLTPDNVRDVLTPLLRAAAGGEPPFCVNLSVDVDSVEVIGLCREVGAPYVDTVVEPWPGVYDNPALPLAQRTNLALRRRLLDDRAAHPTGPTAVSSCGANPGMVSWLTKQALLDLAAITGVDAPVGGPADRAGWAALMQACGVKGVHIAERDTQRPVRPKPVGAFWNTWSVDGFISEGLQPAELGWGTHERWLPPGAGGHGDPAAPGIFLPTPGADTRVRTWCPTHGPQHGFLVTHNEALSIADYFSVRDGDAVTYRPTCHYAYRPAEVALLSWGELLGGGAITAKHVLDADEIADGIDELGVLLYGSDAGAYWYGSRLSNDEARALAPHQSATGLQVTSAVLAAMVWALEHPDRGIVEADEMDFARCLEVQRPYLGPVEGHRTDWTPLTDRSPLFPDDIDETDPWQFRNVLVH